MAVGNWGHDLEVSLSTRKGKIWGVLDFLSANRYETTDNAHSVWVRYSSSQSASILTRGFGVKSDVLIKAKSLSMAIENALILRPQGNSDFQSSQGREG